MEHLQRVWLASRERLPLRTPGSVPLFGGLACALIVETSFPRLYTNLMTVPKLTFTEMRGFHGAFATGVASHQGALTLPDTWFRPSFWDLLMLQLLRPNSSNLPCLYSTFHLEYPLVLSRFCSILAKITVCISTTWWVTLLVDHRSPRAHEAEFYGRLRLICSVLRTFNVSIIN